MASKKSKTTAPDIGVLLGSAVAAVQNNQPFYQTKEAMAGLLAHPSGQLVEFNEGMKDPADGNKIAFRATALGMQTYPAWTGGQPAAPSNPNPPPQTSARVFTFDEAVPIPAARRGGRGQNTYGFEQMNVGQSFFIAMTGDNPNPSKRVASTVSSASKRMAPKVFIVRSVDETAQGRGKGARVWRTA